MEEEIIKTIISEVNRTLNVFDRSGCTSAKRFGNVTDDNIKDKCEEFDKFVECRFNFEFAKLDKFKDLFIELEGNVFSCTLTEPNTVKRNFKLATLSIEIPKTLLDSNEILSNEVKSLIDWIGGDTITFTHKKKKFTYKIYYKEDEENPNISK